MLRPAPTHASSFRAPRSRRARATVALALAVAASLVPSAPGEGAGSLLGTPGAQRVLHRALADLDCRVLQAPDADRGRVPWCLHPSQARASANAEAEARAVAEGLARLRDGGFGEVLRGGTVVHFGAGNEHLRALRGDDDRTLTAEEVHARAAADDVARSYYLHEQGVIALRPGAWEQEVLRQLRRQPATRRAALDAIAFPVQLALYHEFGHRMLDHEEGAVSHGSRAEAAADLFAAIVVARQHALDFAQVARALARARAVREPVEDDVHRNGNLLYASLARLEPAGHGPAPSFAAVRRIVFALAESAIATAQASPPGACEPAEPGPEAPAAQDGTAGAAGAPAETTEPRDGC